MLKALIFDCGGVLARPENGDWQIPREMEGILKGRAVQDVRMAQALAAEEWLNESQRLTTLEQEMELRLGFLRAFTNDLGIYVETDALAGWARRVTYDPERYVPYEDARPWLERWKPRYQLGMLSDAMPSMKVAMEHCGLLALFDCAVASCEVGATKPAPAMYQAILDGLKVEPAESLFVDDLPRNLRAAQAMGLETARMQRPVYLTYRAPSKDKPWDGATVTSMEELDGLLS